MNEWKLSGECFRVNKFDFTRDFAGTISVRGMSKRQGCVSGHIIEMAIYVSNELWEEFVGKMKPYSQVKVTGHFETWQSESDSGKIKTKIAYVADTVSYFKEY